MDPFVRSAPSSRPRDPGLGGAWARLLEQTPPKMGPQLLVAFFNGWLAARSGMITAQSAGPVDIVPPMVAGAWFYSIVLLRLWRVGPLGRSFVAVWRTFGSCSSATRSGWDSFLLARATRPLDGWSGYWSSQLPASR